MVKLTLSEGNNELSKIVLSLREWVLCKEVFSETFINEIQETQEVTIPTCQEYDKGEFATDEQIAVFQDHLELGLLKEISQFFHTAFVKSNGNTTFILRVTCIDIQGVKS